MSRKCKQFEALTEEYTFDESDISQHGHAVAHVQQLQGKRIVRQTAIVLNVPPPLVLNHPTSEADHGYKLPTIEELLNEAVNLEFDEVFGEPIDMQSAAGVTVDGKQQHMRQEGGFITVSAHLITDN